MTEPLVCAILLTKDRPEMAKRAVECFRSQTYQNKHLLVVDNVSEPDRPGGVVEYYAAPPERYKTIGELRNFANSHAAGADILIHWDDDDWSHHNRISEQVALLQASGKQAVGYRDMLFWRYERAVPWDTVSCGCGNRYPRSGAPCPQCHQYPNGEAWLYSSTDPRYCLGTSLCYWREVWEKRPFKAISRGEDFEFQKELDRVGVTSIGQEIHRSQQFIVDAPHQPRMIASIHGGNHVVYEPEKSAPPPAGNWKRVPEWDDYCRKTMSL